MNHIYGVWIGLAAFALAAGCGPSARADAEEDNETAEELSPTDRPEDKAAGGAEADLAGARELVDSIYTAYVTDEGDGGEVMSPDLIRTIQDPAAGLWDEDMGLGFDPFCACQDYGEVSYEITRLEATGPGRAEAEVRLTSFGRTENFRLALVDVRDDPVVDGWRVDDVGTVGEPSLRDQAAAR